MLHNIGKDNIRIMLRDDAEKKMVGQPKTCIHRHRRSLYSCEEVVRKTKRVLERHLVLESLSSAPCRLDIKNPVTHCPIRNPWAPQFLQVYARGMPINVKYKMRARQGDRDNENTHLAVFGSFVGNQTNNNQSND